MSRRRIGVLGGTFDPIHYGHLVMGQEAYMRLQLDLVLFVPAGQPPHKMHRHVSDAKVRAHMVKLAIQDNPAFQLSLTDLERPGPSYTADLLELLHVKHAGSEFYFIVGMDSLEEILTWRNPQRILELAYIVGVPRPGYSLVSPASLAAELPAAESRIQIIDMPLLSISSSELQRRVQHDLPLRYLVPPAVEAYIHEHSLYQK